MGKIGAANEQTAKEHPATNEQNKNETYSRTNK
jgi:hypothetical protein